MNADKRRLSFVAPSQSLHATDHAYSRNNPEKSPENDSTTLQCKVLYIEEFPRYLTSRFLIRRFLTMISEYRRVICCWMGFGLLVRCMAYFFAANISELEAPLWHGLPARGLSMHHARQRHRLEAHATIVKIAMAIRDAFLQSKKILAFICVHPRSSAAKLSSAY